MSVNTARTRPWKRNYNIALLCYFPNQKKIEHRLLSLFASWIRIRFLCLHGIIATMKFEDENIANYGTLQCSALFRFIQIAIPLSVNRNKINQNSAWCDLLPSRFFNFPKAVMYDERPKMKRDTQQKSSLFPEKRTAFLSVRLKRGKK